MNTLLLIASLITGQPESPNSTEAAGASIESEVLTSNASPSEAVRKIAENSPSNTMVGSAVSTEEANSTEPRYAITSGNEGDIFAIDSKSGQITVKNSSALDYESRSTYELTVEVTTTADPNDENQQRFIEQLRKTGADEETIAEALHRTIERVVRIELDDVNESPQFEERSFRIRGNSEAGTVVGVLHAFDPDHGDQLHYTTGDEDTSRVFAIDEVSGEITVHDSEALRANVSGHAQYDFQATFQVADAIGLVDVASITIVIDSPPVTPVIAEIPVSAPPTTDTTPLTASGGDSEGASTQTKSATEMPIAVPIAENEPEAQVVTMSPEIENPQPFAGTAPAEPAETVAANGGGSGWFSRFLNVVLLAFLTGGGWYVYRQSRSQRDVVERGRAEAARLATVGHSLESQKTSIENLRSQLEAEKSRLEENKASVTAREERVAALEKELEAQRVELADAAERVQGEQASLEAERKKLADAFQEIERHEKELAERKAAFDATASSDERSATSSVDAAERLIDMASESELQLPDVESAEVLDLRNKLADMFGVSETEFSRPRSVRTETEYDGIVKADDRDLAGVSTQAAPTQSAASSVAIETDTKSPEPAAEEAPDSVAAYMQQLLERQRVRQLYGSSDVSSPPVVQRPVATSMATSVQSPSKPESDLHAQKAVEPPKPISETPVHPQDKDAVRTGLSNLREVANQAARSAVLKHTKRKLRNHSLIKIGSAVAAFLMAGIVFAGGIPVTSMLGWTAIGIGAIILVDLGHWAYITRKTVPRVTKPRD